MGYTVTAPLVVAHTPNGDAYVFEGGVLPTNVDETQLEQLVASGMVVESDDPVDAEDTEDEGAADGTIAEVLDAVGDDPEKAAAALEAEQAGKNRSTLVAKLQAIIEGDES